MYFVSYSHAGLHGHGFGMCTTNTYPRTMDYVRAIARSIEEGEGWAINSVVILNWIPLTGEK